MSKNKQKNVLGQELQPCCLDPITGFQRDGYCSLVQYDRGLHIVCAVVTKEFLHFSKLRGNDLSTRTESFHGLKPGDKWCLCITRWLEAYNANVAPKVILESSHISCLEFIELEDLKKYEFKTH
ncbi:MAG: DUF2237 domain-containing protein [Rickettsiales bacterium]|nr:DUF2237 domain-containing protein [Rickettsiales bacterium]